VCGALRSTPVWPSPSRFSRTRAEVCSSWRTSSAFNRGPLGCATNGERVVARQRADERRVEGEVVARWMAGAAGAAVAAEGLLEEQAPPLFDQGLIGCPRPGGAPAGAAAVPTAPNHPRPRRRVRELAIAIPPTMLIALDPRGCGRRGDPG
jgi:hypothetical protein